MQSAKPNSIIVDFFNSFIINGANAPTLIPNKKSKGIEKFG